jgi:hypothetical protein
MCAALVALLSHAAVRASACGGHAAARRCRRERGASEPWIANARMYCGVGGRGRGVARTAVARGAAGASCWCEVLELSVRRRRWLSCGRARHKAAVFMCGLPFSRTEPQPVPAGRTGALCRLSLAASRCTGANSSCVPTAPHRCLSDTFGQSHCLSPAPSRSRDLPRRCSICVRWAAAPAAVSRSHSAAGDSAGGPQRRSPKGAPRSRPSTPTACICCVATLRSSPSRVRTSWREPRRGRFRR